MPHEDAKSAAAWIRAQRVTGLSLHQLQAQLRTQFDTHGSYYTLLRMRERGLNEKNDDFTEEFHRLRDFVARDFLAQP